MPPVLPCVNVACFPEGSLVQVRFYETDFSLLIPSSFNPDFLSSYYLFYDGVYKTSNSNCPNDRLQFACYHDGPSQSWQNDFMAKSQTQFRIRILIKPQARIEKSLLCPLTIMAYSQFWNERLTEAKRVDY